MAAFGVFSYFGVCRGLSGLTVGGELLSFKEPSCVFQRWLWAWRGEKRTKGASGLAGRSLSVRLQAPLGPLPLVIGLMPSVSLSCLGKCDGEKVWFLL